MPSSSTSPVLRQTLIVLSFLAVVGLFFAVNHFVIIPRQQQEYNNKVFRVLQEVADGFEKTVNGKAGHFAKNFRAGSSTFTALDNSGEVDSAGLKNALFQSFKSLGATKDRSDSFIKTSGFIPDSVRVWLNDPRTKQQPDADTAFAIKEILEPTLDVLHKDFFNLVMLVKRETDTLNERDTKKARILDKLLYKHGELAAAYLFPGDSLFQTPRFGQFSSIDDITVAGSAYKAFSMPFRVAGQELLLTGFLEEKTYRIATTSYSKPTLLWVLLLLTLFVLSLPLIKIYLASREERISTNDLRMLMVVFIAVPLLVTLVAATIIIYRQASDRSAAEVSLLHRSVQDAFSNEIFTALKQLENYNNLLRQDEPNLWNAYLQNKQAFSADTRKAEFQDRLLLPYVYPNADDVFWIDTNGKQVAKWIFLKNEKVSYFDVSSRSYFQQLNKDHGFRLQGIPFSIEPTISWSTGKYSINILTPIQQTFLNPAASDSAKAVMIGLSGKMQSVYKPVLPKGFNFCIADEQGNILFHSQTERCLYENLFRESNDNPDLRNAIARRDDVSMSDAQLFGKNVKLHLSPLRNMPSLFLVAYFNKREQNLFVFHVSAFTMLCASLALFGLLLLMLLYYFFGSSPRKQRFRSYESAWMKPSGSKKVFYRQNILQLAATFFLSLFFIPVIVPAGGNVHWYILQVSVLLPFFILTGYILLRNEYNAHRNAAPIISNSDTNEVADANETKTKPSLLNILWTGFKSFAKRNYRVLVIYAIAICFILLSINYFQERAFRMVPVLSVISLPLLIPVLAFIISRYHSRAAAGNSTRYLRLYTTLVFLTTIMTAVLPVLGICSFALNEERTMQVKATQFHLAKKLEERRDSINSYLHSTRLAPAIADEQNCYKFSAGYGVYPLHNVVDTVRFRDKDKDSTFVTHSGFYQDVTRYLFLPKDHVDFFDDNFSYYWYKGKNDGSVALMYRNETDRVTPFSLSLKDRYEGKSVFGSLFSGYGGWLVLLSVIAFFILLFMLIQEVTKKIFLLTYFDYDKTFHVDQSWLAKFFPALPPGAEEWQYLGATNGMIDNSHIVKKEAGNYNTEEENETILHLQHLLTPAYDGMWKELKPNEQLVLYDFAIDGFTNYKNVDILYGLYRRGLIVKKDQQLELMNYSFRSYLLGKAGTKEILELEKELNQGSTWKNLKNVFFILFFAIMIFLFITQQDVSNRILAIVSGMATLVPLLLKIFDKGAASGKKQPE